MATTNRYYNDPNIGQGFANLASMFAPPSGSDLAGYATASAKKEEAARLAELFNYANDPNYNRELFERRAIAAGIYNPTQSYYSVDQGNAVTMRGQDVTARTALQTNEADNLAAMARQQLVQKHLDSNAALDRGNAVTLKMLDPVGANETRFVPKSIADLYGQPETQMGYDKVAADNVAAMQRQQLVQNELTRNKALDRETEVIKTLLAPVAKDATRFVPGSVASTYTLPEQQIGIVSAQPGEVNTLPDGRVVRGDPKPLSETEWQAQENARLLKNGILTDQMIADAVTGKETPVTVLRPGDNSPTFATPGEATRLNLPAFINRGADAKPTNYKTPDGRMGTAVVGPSGRLVDTQTGADLPQGTVTFGTNVQGTATDTGISTNANQTEATRREAELKYGLSRVQEFRKLLAANPGVLGVPGTIRGIAQDIRNAVQETSAAYGDEIPAFKSMEDMKSFIDGVAQKNGYDPAIRQAQALASEMAYIDAKTADPSGEVNVKEWERLMDKYDGGASGNAGALAALDVLEQSMNTRMQLQVDTLRNPGQTTGQQPAAAEEEWIRGPDGKLMRKP